MSVQLRFFIADYKRMPGKKKAGICIYGSQDKLPELPFTVMKEGCF